MWILCDCVIYFIRFPWNVYVWPLPWLGGLVIYGSYKRSKVDLPVKCYNNIIQLQFCDECARGSSEPILGAPSPTPFLPAAYAARTLEATAPWRAGRRPEGAPWSTPSPLPPPRPPPALWKTFLGSLRTGVQKQHAHLRTCLNFLLAENHVFSHERRSPRGSSDPGRGRGGGGR